MKSFFSLIAYCLLGAAALTAVASVLNHFLGWQLGLAIGGFDVGLLPDLGSNLVLAFTLVLLAGIFELMSKPKEALEWVKTHRAITATILIVSLGIIFLGVMNLTGGPLGFAVEAGDTEKVRDVLADKRYPAQELNPHLYQALKNGRIEMAKLLYEAGADINHKSGEFNTPLLSSAVIWFPREAVQQLLDWKPDPNATDTMGRTPAILLLLYRSNNFSQESEGDRLALVQKLGEIGADFSLAGRDGETAVTIATSKKQTQLLEYFNSKP